MFNLGVVAIIIYGSKYASAVLPLPTSYLLDNKWDAHCQKNWEKREKIQISTFTEFLKLTIDTCKILTLLEIISLFLFF